MGLPRATQWRIDSTALSSILTEMKKWLLIALALGAAAGLICWLLRPSARPPAPLADELSAPAQHDTATVEPVTNRPVAPTASPEQSSSTPSTPSTPLTSASRNDAGIPSPQPITPPSSEPSS